VSDRPMTAVDIETIPNPAMEDSMPMPEAAGNLKDPEKIKADIERKRADQIGRMALSPLTGRVCCVSHWGEDHGYAVMRTINDDEERLMISEAFCLFTMTGNYAPRIVTWNGHGFDLPFIYKRAMILRVPIPTGCYRLSAMVKRYSRAPSCDLMQEFAAWGKDYTSLDIAARAILGKKKLDHDFTRFPQMIVDGASNEIGTYCENDARLTFELYQVISEYVF
jgi:predicted PolB exonuclease-like 3'-5' exonuclease